MSRPECGARHLSCPSRPGPLKAVSTSRRGNPMSSASTTRNARAMVLCAIAAAASSGVAASAASAQAPARLPVFDVTSSGASKAQAERLAGALGISVQLLGENGLLSYIDQDNFGALPVKQVTTPDA